jgi:DnaJ-class molecular chaperone
MSDLLKPCPCCGRKATLHDRYESNKYPSRHFIACICGMRTGNSQKHIAIETWNRRPRPTDEPCGTCGGKGWTVKYSGSGAQGKKVCSKCNGTGRQTRDGSE